MTKLFRFVSFPEFQALEALLCAPDALYKVALQLFDTNGNGSISYGIILRAIWKSGTSVFMPDLFYRGVCGGYSKNDTSSEVTFRFQVRFLQLLLWS